MLLLTGEGSSGERPLHLVDGVALVGAAGLALALGRGSSFSRTDPLPVLLAPLCCLAAGALVFRAAAPLLRAGERASRGGPLVLRLALVNLGRSPAAAATALACLAVSIGLGGFALAYRATLTRSAADQAADQVPLDATVTSGPSFVTPLRAAALARWQTAGAGPVLAINRTEASYPRGTATASVPVIGMPASALSLLHGWRDSDASASRGVLARRLVLPGPPRTAGPLLSAATRSIIVRASATGFGVGVTADLRSADGAVRRLALGLALARPRALHAALPAGRWELAALELDLPAGLAATNGHQNAENPAAAPLNPARVRVGAVVALDASRREIGRAEVRTWQARGAADFAHPAGSDLGVRFSDRASVGVLRPAQPSDVRPIPVLVDPATAAASGPGGGLALAVDGAPVNARIVGVLRRFPTVPAEAGGFVVADAATLGGAVDAQAPGKGEANELWLAGPGLGGARPGLRSPADAPLAYAFRSAIERRLRSDPIARGVLWTLDMGAALGLALSALGITVTLTGSGRDEQVERDLSAQGLGPGALRADLRLRMIVIAALGVLVGLGLAVLLARLAVAAVRAAATLSPPSPSLVAVIPWDELAVMGLGALVLLAASAWMASTSVGRAR